jgi:stalled ribosome rescue protein Dom34
MKKQKTLGIWMDHSTANLIDLESKKDNHSIVSDFTFDTQEEALSRSENLMHNKRQQMHEAYYKKIAAVILKFEHVLLFGPTNAKTELYNYVNADLRFKHIKIETKAADKMTDNKKVAFVRNYFEHL